MQRSEIDTIKYHTWPRIPMGKWQTHRDTTNESQEVSPFPAGDHKAHINRRAQRHSKHKTEQKHKRSKAKFYYTNLILLYKKGYMGTVGQ